VSNDNSYFSDCINNNGGFASFSSLQTASRVGSRDLFVSHAGSSAQIHLGIELGFLRNVPVQTPHKGLHQKIYIKYYMLFTHISM
jgi:hypothetical protein